MPNIVNRPEYNYEEHVTYIDKPNNYSIVDQVNIDDNGKMNKAMEKEFLNIAKQASDEKMMSAAQRKKR